MPATLYPAMAPTNATRGWILTLLPIIRGALKDRPDDADVIELLDLVSKAHGISPGEIVITPDEE